MRRWSVTEIEVLKNHYISGNQDLILSLLNSRTWTAIKLKARSLGLSRFKISENHLYCKVCGRTKTIDKFRSRVRGDKGTKGATCRNCYNKHERARYQKNKEYEHTRSKNKYLKLRSKVLNEYGNECVCCGETNKDFLAVDHINNDGSNHRKTLGLSGGGCNFYYWLQRNNWPNGFQILCMNCNFSKYLNGGKCIHEIEKPDE